MNRHFLAYAVLIFSTGAISILAIFTILENPEEAQDIFNIVLPVLASWVGTVLAYYFGRENFESANKQVKEIVEKLAPEERAKSRVVSIMRAFRDIICFQMEQNQSAESIHLLQLKQKINSATSRIPIVDVSNKPILMIHNSAIDHFIASGNSTETTLGEFLTWHKARGMQFNAGSGFVVVAANSTISDAKRKMESAVACQDIFITRDGTVNEPLVGWISNVRLAKFLST